MWCLIFFKIRIKYFFLFVLILSVGSYIFQYVLNFSTSNEHAVIIWWTPLMAQDEQLITCSNQYKCLLTKDRNYIDDRNLQAFLFYGSTLDYKNLPLPKNKIWAIFHEESPRNAAVFLYERTFEIFDIKSTFSRHSDLPLTLQYLENISIITDDRYVVSIEEKNQRLSSLAPVLYIQSDCDTPIDRDAYVKKLMKYIKIDSFGSCLKNKKFPKEIYDIDTLDIYNKKFLEFISKYKFIISFENAICEDYITEKLWRPLMVGSIPIYLGSPSIEDWLPNKNSAILAKNFANPIELAYYIKLVNANASLYESYLDHKKGKIDNEMLKTTLSKGPFGIKTDLGHPIPAFECFVCEQIHKGFKKSSSKPVYDCLQPPKGNSWEYFWYTGDCDSKTLEYYVKTKNLKDFC